MDCGFGSNRAHAFDTYETISSRSVFLGDNGMVEALGKGSMLVESHVKGKVRKIRIYDVLHVPKLHANLLSVGKLIARGLKVHFNKSGCIVCTQEGQMLAMASLEANLYQMELKVVKGAEVSTLAHTSAKEDNTLELWHKRLGHLNVKSVNTLKHMVIGMDLGKCWSNVRGVWRASKQGSPFQRMEQPGPPSHWSLCIQMYVGQ